MVSGIFFLGCTSAKKFPSPEDYPGEQIHFGQGGGFTGNVVYFTLLDNGHLYQFNTRDSTFTHLDKWPRDFSKQMVQAYHTLQLDSLNYYEPGDIYHFIGYKKKNGALHRITWGNNRFVPDPKVVNYFNLLYKSTKPGS
jgi:hypothetical protein